MRLNIQRWNEAGLHWAGAPAIVAAFMNDRRTFDILYKHLGAARVRGVRELDMFWIIPSAKSAERAGGPSVLDFRYFRAKRKVTCRIMMSAPPLSEREPRWSKFRVEHVGEVERRTLEILALVQKRLLESDIATDFSATKKALERDFAKLVRAT